MLKWLKLYTVPNKVLIECIHSFLWVLSHFWHGSEGYFTLFSHPCEIHTGCIGFQSQVALWQFSSALIWIVWVLYQLPPRPHHAPVNQITPVCVLPSENCSSSSLPRAWQNPMFTYSLHSVNRKLELPINVSCSVNLFKTLKLIWCNGTYFNLFLTLLKKLPFLEASVTICVTDYFAQAVDPSGQILCLAGV